MLRSLVATWLVLATAAGAQSQSPSNGAPPLASADADLEQGLERARVLQDAGDFGAAVQLCNGLVSRFPSHPDIGKARAMLQKLTQAKRETLQLSFAIETLESERSEDRRVAKAQLMEAGDVGAILLRKTVRKGPPKGAITAVSALEELGDPQAVRAYADRLSVEIPGPLTEALIRAFEARLYLTDRDRDALAGPLASLFELVKTDAVLARRDVAGLLLRFLSEWFDCKGQPFDAFLNQPGAFDTLKEYVKRADASTNNEVAAWASTRLTSVGMANTAGLIGWWQLNEKAGEVARDSTTNRLHGTLTGGPVWCPEVMGGALRFDGTTNQVVSKPGAFAGISNTFTMALWAYPTAARLSAPEANEGVSGTREQRYAMHPIPEGPYGHAGAGISIGTNGVSVFEHANGYLPALAVYDAPLTNWTHVAAVYVNGQPRIWINGTLVRTGLVSRMIVHPCQYLGDVSGYGCFAGMLRDVRIYNRALADKEVYALGFSGAATRSPSVPSATKP